MNQLLRIILAFIFSLTAPYSLMAESRCRRADYIFSDGIGCVMNTRPGEWVTIIAQYNERFEIDPPPSDTAIVTIPGYNKEMRLYHGERKTLKFLAKGNRVEARYHIVDYDDDDHITIEGFTSRSNLQMINTRMNTDTGDITMAFGVSPGEKFYPQDRVCIELWYGRDGQRTTPVAERCIGECVGRSSCMGQKLVKHNERPPMKLGENQLIAVIDPHNRHPETKGADNTTIHTIDDFLVEDIRHILRNKGWHVAASIQDIWFNGQERIADLNQKGGMDFRGPSSVLRTNLVNMDWLIDNAPLGSGINRNVNRLNDWGRYLARNPRNIIKANIRRLKSRYRRQPVFPISDINQNGRALLEQVALSFGTDLLSNPYNDVYAAVGRVGIRGIPIGTATRLGKGKFRVTITGVGVVVFDSFDFQGDQPLGCWARWHTGPEPIPYITECVGNRDFRYYRKIKKRGGDFIIQTPVKQYNAVFPVQFIVNLRR